MLPISIHVALGGFAPSRGMSTPLLRMRGFDYTNQQNSRFEMESAQLRASGTVNYWGRTGKC